MKKIKARFVVGPPGTGKTHIFLLEKYKECFLKYNPEKNNFNFSYQSCI